MNMNNKVWEIYISDFYYNNKGRLYNPKMDLLVLHTSISKNYIESFDAKDLFNIVFYTNKQSNI